MCVIYLSSILNKMCINTSHVLALCEMQQLWCKWTNHSGVHSTNKHPWRNEHSLGKDQKQSSQILISTCAHMDFCLPKSQIQKTTKFNFYLVSWISITTLRSVSSSFLLHWLTCQAAWFCINLSFGNDWLIKTQPTTTLFSALWVWVFGELFILFSFSWAPSTTSFHFIFLYNREL